MWELDFLVATQQMSPAVAALLRSLHTSEDSEQANHVMCLIEAAIAPVSGGLSPQAGSVATALIAGLPYMGEVAQDSALLLLTGIIGTVGRVGTTAAARVGQIIESALPQLCWVIACGSNNVKAQGVDLLSLCAELSPAAAGRARFYLARLAVDGSEPLRASAERELRAVSAAPDARRYRPAVEEPQSELRPYIGYVWLGDWHTAERINVAIEATGPQHAYDILVAEYGEDYGISVWNEEDARRPR